MKGWADGSQDALWSRKEVSSTVRSSASPQVEAWSFEEAIGFSSDLKALSSVQ